LAAHFCGSFQRGWQAVGYQDQLFQPSDTILWNEGEALHWKGKDRVQLMRMNPESNLTVRYPKQCLCDVPSWTRHKAGQGQAWGTFHLFDFEQLTVCKSTEGSATIWIYCLRLNISMKGPGSYLISASLQMDKRLKEMLHFSQRLRLSF
jgi:hypothetical protein